MSRGGQREGSGRPSKQGQGIKKRSWAFVVYPTKEYLDSVGSSYDGSSGYGSAPENWQEILKLSGVVCAISPLHEDTNPDETEKKPHWHVIAVYGSPTTFNNVKQLSQVSLNGSNPIPLERIRGYYRYLTHKDNPEKVQYSEDDIKTVNGFCIADFVELTKSEVDEIKWRLHGLIIERDITEYSALMDYLRYNEMHVEHSIANSSTIFFNAYIKSRRHSKAVRPVEVVRVDSETGEVIE
jgi:hypothetical protein